MAKVFLENIHKRFQPDVTAVRNLTLSVDPGEFLVLLGPSGCGKTTVLRLVAGLEEVTSGRIYIDDRDVTNIPPRSRDIAMVFQNYALYPHMTAYDNIAFGLRMSKEPENEINERVHDAAGILDIGHLLDRRPKALSGGERQRVALGRALVRKPTVFLFDEPLSNLDARLRVQMRHEIVRIHRRFEAVSIYVTHDQFEAMTMGDRIAVLKEGELQQVGTPETLYHRPANRFVAEFIGTPSINVLRGKLDIHRQCFSNAAVEIPLKNLLENLPEELPKDVDYGIRPELFSLQKRTELIGIKGEMERLELLGGEYHLYVRFGEELLVARVSGSPDQEIREAREISLYFDPSQGHLFDTKTGISLKPESIPSE